MPRTDPPSPFSGPLALHGGPLDRPALDALFPDFAADPAPLLALWSGRRRRMLLRRRAAARGVPVAVFDHGLLRAPPRGGRGAPLLSITAIALEGPPSAADRLAVARLLQSRGWETPELLRRAAAARRTLLSHRVGGAWWLSDRLPDAAGMALVAGDETTGPSLVRAMLDRALAATAAGKIVLLAPGGAARHPVFAEAAALGCTVIRDPVDPWAAIDRADRVYAAGGEIGFLALLAGREVCCFGNSFYAGWGVSSDAPSVAQHPFRRNLDEIFAGACFVATRCRDPFRNTAASFEETTALLALWKDAERANRQVAACIGMSFWKRRRIALFLRSTAPPPVFCRTASGALAAAHARPGAAIAAWAARMPAGLEAAAAAHGVPLIRVEDGFIRSVGLGSDFLPAASLVFDGRGLYCDPRQPSDLEALLRETEFGPALRARAQRLIVALVARGVTKYNLRSPAPELGAPPGKRRILVPGQVEDDLSVRLGGGEIRGNLDLLQRVRAANPEAFVLYKPHPDVEAGHRAGYVPEPQALGFADRVVRGVSTAALFEEIDEVHTLTSLAGFEALLRRRRVVVYGAPFYAGWGLTTDVAAPYRGRGLTLDELVAGTLILYPRYLDPLTRLPCPPEIVVERLAEEVRWRPHPLVAARRLQGRLARRRQRFSWSPAPPGDVRPGTRRPSPSQL